MHIPIYATRFSLVSKYTSGQFRRTFRSVAFCLFVLLSLSGAVFAGRLTGPVPAAEAASAVPLRPFVYVSPSSKTSYDIMLSDGVSKDWRVARIKVDSVFFGNLSARLSTDASTTAFRVSGDRLGGSSIYSVDTRTGKYAQVAYSKTASEGFGAFAWSPAGNTMAFVRSTPALDPAAVDSAYGTIYIYSVGFQASRLANSDGNDRLLAFAADGLGVYVERREGTDANALYDLVYLPLGGGNPQFVLRSQPNLRYSHFAVWVYQGYSARLACLVEGDYSLAAQAVPAGVHAPTSIVSTDGKMQKPTGLGLVVADTVAPSPLLLRRDMEDFPFVQWAANGVDILVGGSRTGATWSVNVSGKRGASTLPCAI